MNQLNKFSGNTLYELVRYRAHIQGDEIAYTHLRGKNDNKEITYAKFEQRILALASRLQKYDIKGERVVLLYPTGIDYIVAYFAVIFSGAIAVPVYEPRQSSHFSRLVSIIDDAKAKLLLTLEQTLRITSKNLLDDLNQYGAQLLATDDLELSSTLAKQWQPLSFDLDDVVFLQYTSGSTGNPKGVMVSNRNILHNSEAMYNATQPTSNSCLVSWLPPYHDMGLVGALIQPLYAGYPCVLMSPISAIQRPIKFLKAIHDYKATIAGGPNFIYEACVNRLTEKQLEGIDLSSWKVAVNGAEPINADTIRRFSEKFKNYGFNVNAHFPCYGMAETTLLVSSTRFNHGATVSSYNKAKLKHNLAVPDQGQNSQSLVSSGRVTNELTVKIVNPDDYTECEQGQIGEVWIRGDSVTQGYWQREEIICEGFSGLLKGDDQHKYLRTGDLAFFDNNELFITGRIKDVVIIRGENHYPQDFEYSAAKTHPALKLGTGAAFSVTHQGLEQLVILQELNRRMGEQTQIEIAESIRSRLSIDHQVKLFDLTFINPGTLPKTTSGKIQRHAAKSMYLINFYGEMCREI